MLTDLPQCYFIRAVRGLDGCGGNFEESPGSSKAGCRVTPGQCELRDSATESKPPILLVRVKGCGKSAPRFGQPKWQGKPHLEQDQIGMAYGGPYRCHPGRSHEAPGNRRPR